MYDVGNHSNAKYRLHYEKIYIYDIAIKTLSSIKSRSSPVGLNFQTFIKYLIKPILS